MTRTRAFRDALAKFPTGVTLVTVADEGKAKAMTVNSFASVSLDPPLVLWSLAKDSRRFGLFRDAGVFGISVLAADQQALSDACARDDNLERSGARWQFGTSGAPLVDDTIARFECRTVARHDAGDHIIVIAEVLGFDTPRDAPALVFHKSVYGRA